MVNKVKINIIYTDSDFIDGYVFVDGDNNDSNYERHLLNLLINQKVLTVYDPENSNKAYRVKTDDIFSIEIIVCEEFNNNSNKKVIV